MTRTSRWPEYSSAPTRSCRLDAHVQEAPEHVDHVIGVNGGEHQVAGKRRLDGDLRGFVVANFAHHDLVRVVAQNRAQAARKGQALLFVHRNLGNAADLIFDGIFNGDDLVFVGLDFVDGGVERGRFAAARGPVTSTMPYGSLM